MKEPSEAENNAVSYFLLAKDMWEKSRPNLVRQLKASGELEKALRSAGESTFALESQLSEKGVPPFMARSEAIRMYIALPDIPRERPKRRRSSSSSPRRTAMNPSVRSVRVARAILHVLAFVGMCSLVRLSTRPLLDDALGPDASMNLWAYPEALLALVFFLVFFGVWLFAVIGERRSSGRLFPPEPWEID